VKQNLYKAVLKLLFRAKQSVSAYATFQLF